MDALLINRGSGLGDTATGTASDAVNIKTLVRSSEEGGLIFHNLSGDTTIYLAFDTADEPHTPTSTDTAVPPGGTLPLIITPRDATRLRTVTASGSAAWVANVTSGGVLQ